jgi:hypothetical protein
MSRPAGDERRQLQWFVSAGAFPVVYGVSAFAGSVNPERLLDVALASIAIAVGIAVVKLKYHACDMDLIARPTLVSGVLTGGQQ